MNTLEDIAASVNHTLARFGRPSLPLDLVRQYVGDGVDALMTRAFGSLPTGLADVVSVYKEHHRLHFMDRSSLYPGVAETLHAFRTLPLAVISNKTIEFVEPLLERLGIARSFTFIIGADSGLPLKPAPDAVQSVLAASGAPKEAAVIVGDGTTDIRAGKAAGITTCAVAYGFRSEEELRRAGPDYLISRFSELTALFTGETMP